MFKFHRLIHSHYPHVPGVPWVPHRLLSVASYQSKEQLVLSTTWNSRIQNTDSSKINLV